MIYKLLAKLSKGHRDSIQINKIRNEKGDTTTETEEIKKKKIIRPTTKAYTQKTGKSGVIVHLFIKMNNFVDRYQIQSDIPSKKSHNL